MTVGRPQRGASFSIISLQMAVGVFQALIGVMMLVAPHQFATPGYATLQPHLDLWGIALLLAGAGLMAVALLQLSTPFEFAAHLFSGATLIVLAYGVAVVAAWTGTINFAVLGLGTFAAPLLTRMKARKPGDGRDLLAIVVGTGAVLTGAVILLLPSQFGSPLFDPVRAFLPLLGAAFLLSGFLPVAVSAWADAPRLAVWAAHLSAGAVFLWFFVSAAMPLRAWIGLAYYGGFGIAIASLPRWRGWLVTRDRASLRVRLALALSLVAVTPLLLTTSFVLGRQEEATLQLAQAYQERLAASIARDVSDYVGQHRAAVVGLAALPVLLDGLPEAQHATLKAFASAYPEIYALATTDLTGRQIARSDDLPLAGGTGGKLYELVRQTNRAEVVAQISPVTRLPVMAIGSPVPGPDGRPRGYMVEGVELSKVLEVISRAASAGTKAYLVDNSGHVIAHPDGALAASFADLSEQPPVAAMLEDQAGYGSLRYGPAASEKLAGYARVPDLSWGVVIEQPLAQVLAGSRAQRDIAFLVLISSALLAAGLGLVLANTMVRPLRSLATAVGEIAWSNRRVALPEPRVSELQLLSKAIAEMDDRLAATGAERERLFQHIQAQNEELQVASREAQAANETLRAQAKELAHLASFPQLNPSPVIELDTAGNLTYANPAATSLFPDLPALGAQHGLLSDWENVTTRLQRGDLPPSRDVAIGESWYEQTVLYVPQKECFRVYGSDITSRKRAESERERLLAAEHEARRLAEAAVSARDEFLSVAAHELKTPVTGLIGFTQTLLHQMAKQREVDPERLRHSLQVIDRQAQKTSRLVAQLLDISRFDRGQLRLECEQADMVRIVGEVVEAAQAITAKHTISVEAPMPVEASVDPTRIEQVIAHLVDNAIRFSPHGGAIEVSVGQPGDRVEITVRDHGIGIPPEHRAQLFDRFHQAHSDDYRSGMGLGLYISNRIVALHGGQIKVDVPPDGGSRFIIVLPRSSSQSGRQVPAPPVGSLLASVGPMDL